MEKGYYALIKEQAGEHWQEILDIAGVSEEDILAIDVADAAFAPLSQADLDNADKFSWAQYEVYRKYNIGVYNTLWDKVAAMYQRA